MTTFQQVRPIDTLQPPYHLFRRDIEKTILPFAQEHGIGVLVYGPLAHGLLTGRMTTDTTFAADDWRSQSDLFTGDAFRRNLAVVRDLTGVRRAHAIRRSPSWRSPGPSPTRPSTSRSSVPAAPSRSARRRPGPTSSLTPDDLAQIELMLRGEVAVGGPAPEAMPKS